MTNEERALIEGFVQRTGGAPAGGFTGSVPATAPALPPVDREADALLADLFNRYPEARYRITQLAFIQEHALAEAQNQISRLQYELQNAHQAQAAPPPAASPWGAAAQPQPQPQPQPARGLFGGLFGGGQAAPPPSQYQPQPQPQYAPPPPQYAPGYQPGMFQRPGSGFLGSALTTAAGVAGGMVAGNALMNLFSGGHSGGFGGGGFGGGGFGGGGFGGGVMPPQAEPAGNPWGGAAAPDPYDVGGAQKDFAGQDSGWQTDPGNGGGDPAGFDAGGGADQTDSGWTDSAPDDSQNC